MVEKARELAKKAMESLYDGVCTITEYQDAKDPATKRVTQGENITLSDQPCHVSVKSIPAAKQTDAGASINQVVKLFIAPDLKIEPGSKITVVQQGRTSEYQSSGIPAVYATHQEIELESLKEWA